MFWPLVLYCAVDGGFSFYLIYLSKINAFDWSKKAKNFHESTDDQNHREIRIILQSVFYVQYFITGLFFWLGKYKWERFRDFIVHVFILFLSI